MALNFSRHGRLRAKRDVQKDDRLFSSLDGGSSVSIVRVGLAETKNFSEGYEAIFGKKTKAAAPAKKKPAKTTKAPKTKSAAPKRKKTAKKK